MLLLAPPEWELFCSDRDGYVRGRRPFSLYLNHVDGALTENLDLAKPFTGDQLSVKTMGVQGQCSGLESHSTYC